MANRNAMMAGGRVRLRTLILMRWVAIAGQLIAVLVVHYQLGYVLPLVPALLTIAASVLLNLAAMAQRRSALRLGDRDAALYLGYDLVQLAVLLFLTGGIQNPFIILLLAPLIVSATLLSRRSTVILTVMAVVAVITLGYFHYPLPSAEGGMVLPLVYRIGVGFAVCFSAIFIAGYVWRVAEEARRLGDAFGASQLALAREQRVSALGALAAAAAHELGTPLGTITVVAKEMSREVPADSPLAEDVKLLLSQTQRCREILAELSARPEADGGEPYELLTLPALIDAAAGPHEREGIRVEVETHALDGSPAPRARRSPELIHGLGNLLQNAQQFAERRVRVIASWSKEAVALIIADDGPGFPPGLISRLGEPYLSGSSGRDGHMGLGVFIALTLLARGGATVTFGNGADGGAEVVVRWPRDIFAVERT